MIQYEHIGTFIRTKFRRFQTEANGCYICWKNFPTIDELKTHLDLHLNSVVVKNFNASWKALGNEEASLHCNIYLLAARLIFEIRNDTDGDVKIQFIGVFNDTLQFGKLNPNEFPLTIKQGDSITLGSPINGLCGYNHYVIVYEDAKEKHFEKVQDYTVELQIDQIRLNCTDEDNANDNQQVNQLAAVQSTRESASNGILGAKRIHDVLKILPLPWYEPSQYVKELCNASFYAPSTKFQPLLPYNPVYNLVNERRVLTPSNYHEMLSTIIQIEDFTARLIMNNHVKQNRELIPRGNGDFAVKLSPSEGHPLFLIKGDNVWVGHNGDPYLRIRGYVKKVSSQEILLKLRYNAPVEPLPCHSINFEVNRLTFQMERKALDDAKHLNIISLLFPSEHHQIGNEQAPSLPKLQFFDPKIKSDVSQIAAVKHIVAGTAYPLPYLLIGFPGTGKTKVIVESICQLFTFTKNRILVCASSNNVCDEIAQKLIPLLKTTCQLQTPLTQQYNILRLYATSVRRSCKGEELLDNSNFDEKSIPCLAEIYKYRIVVCTLTVAGRLAQGHISKSHFTHLFIDECESAAESYTLIPIVGICCSFNSINANMVLSGDPKQLGPIMRSNILKSSQLSQSLFQRLYNSEPYQANTRTKEYNHRFISKLKNNYRSHPKLVAVPNKLFYNQEIRSSANSAHFKWYSELPFLPKKGFPILFENIDGCPERKIDCRSWYNDIEKDSVLYYVEKLLAIKEPKKIKQSDIGIISPYKRQCINIEEMLEAKDLREVEVGSVEQFQGKEKPIIIISTVRSGGLGFMQERERINVMITRAIGLLIIIGHGKTLLKNPDWGQIIDYTTANCGGEVDLRFDAEAEEVVDYRC